VHSNGVGQNYFDCNPQGVPGDPSTYNLTLASEARSAYPLANSSDVASTCNGGSTSVLIRYNDQTYVSWAYSSAAAGHVTVNNAANGPSCPDASSPTWN
jgi:hypothetical protein